MNRVATISTLGLGRGSAHRNRAIGGRGWHVLCLLLAVALMASLLELGAGTAGAVAPVPGSDAQSAPGVLPPSSVTGESDGGPLKGLRAAHAAREGPPVPNLAARVAAQTQRLDALFPSQAPGAAPSAQTPVWREVGPTNVIHERVDGYTGPTQIKASENARVRKILVDPRDPNVVYVLFGAGGLWKTTDFLHQRPTWTPLTDRLVSVSSGSIAFGKSPDTIYLGLGDPWDNRPMLGGLMYKSTDGGRTWSNPVGLPEASVVNDIAVDTSGPQDAVMVATDNGLFRSTDGGTTYTALQHAAVDDPSTPYDDQLFNGTVVWSIAHTSAGWVLTGANGAELDFGPGFLATSSDHGATWTGDSHTGVGYSSGSRGTLAVGRPGDSVVYLFQGWGSPYEGYQRDVFRSVDGGLTWTALHTTTTAPLNPTPETPAVWVAFYQAWYDQMITVDPTDPSRNTVVIGGDLYTAKTTDGGRSWRMMTQWLGAYGLPYLHGDEHAAAYVAAKQPMLVIGNDGGLADSTDGGATWDFDKNAGIDTAAIFGLASTPASRNEIIIGTQDTGTLIRQGATARFNQVIGGDGMVPAIGQASNAISLGTIYGGAVYRSTFNPQNQVGKWDLSRDFDDDAWFQTPMVAPTAAADPTGQVFYTYTQHQVLRTKDGGLNWSPVLSSDRSGPGATRASTMNLAVDPNSTNGIAVGDFGGVVHITHDGGATWSSPSLLGIGGYDGFNYTIAWAPNRTLYVGSENPAAGAVRVVRSTDGGATWAAVSGAGLPDVPITKLTPDLSDPTGRTVYAGTWIGVFRTTDGGSTWTLFGAGLPHVDVTDIYIAPDGSFIRAASYGRGVWEASLR